MARQPNSTIRHRQRPVLLVRDSAGARLSAARGLARRQGRPLHRVDLSAAGDSGETERMLDRAFKAAANRSAVLFFDEADALFGKRTEVRDSHDRYANLEVGYLLQRLEAHRGIVIIGANRRQHIDDALLKRCRASLRHAG